MPPLRGPAPHAQEGRLALAAACVLALAAPAGAANLDSGFVGNEAALTGGAVTALSRDAGAAWYNPAGLGGMDGTSLDLSASAFALFVRHARGFAEARDGDAAIRVDLSDLRLLSIPSALVAARRLGPRVGGAIGVFVPSADSSSARADQGAAPVGRLKGVTYDTTTSLRVYYPTAAVGWRATPSLRLGGSLSFVYLDAQATDDLTVDVAFGPDGSGFATRSGRASLASFGLRATAAAQWDPAAGWTLGLVLRTPVVQVYESRDGRVRATTRGVTLSDVPGEGVAVETDDFRGWDVATVLPGRVEAGVGRRWAHARAGATLEIAVPTRDEVHSAARHLVVNGRVGARWEVAPTLALGAGLFTDHSPNGSPEGTNQADVDYYGVTAGVELMSPHRLAPGEPADGVVFSTTLALRYAVGLGVAGGGLLDATESPAIRTDVLPVDVVWHELALHVGSAVQF